MRSSFSKAAAAASCVAFAACSGGGTGPGGVAPANNVIPDAGAVAASSSHAGLVFTLSNNAKHNAVLRFRRLANGQLQPAGQTPTGGAGSGNNLNGASHTVELNADRTLLFAVDAGSNDIASFTVSQSTIHQADRVPSGGAEPSSIAISGNVLYVINMISNQITGFTFDASGRLQHIAGSTRALSGTAADQPVDIRFRSDGSALIATEKLSNNIDTFSVSGGVANPAVPHVSAGHTPFGMDITSSDHPIVSEAEDDVPSGATVSSYTLASSGTLSVVSAAVANGQTASCWAALTPDQDVAFIANTGSDTLSSYTVAGSGAITLAHGAAATEAANSAPTDIRVSPDGSFVYVLNQGSHTIGVFSRTGTALSALPPATGLPPTAIGLAVK